MKSSLLLATLFISTSFAKYYYVNVLEVTQTPVLSFIDGTTTFQQSFNPAWITASTGTGGAAGLLVRSQNCSADVGGDCTYCSGDGDKASKLAYAKASSDPCTDPTLYATSADTVTFEPSVYMETYGTEDPRIAYDSSTGIYYMFYTCYGPSDVLLCLATTSNPTSPNSWTRYGAVFPDIQNSKSGALLIMEDGTDYLFWGAGEVRVTTSTDPTAWENEGDLFLEPRSDSFDSQGVESGPPPMQLSDGNYFFIYNSWNETWPTDATAQYHAAWVVLDGSLPSTIVQRADEPFLFPTLSWEQGVSPYTCNAPRVVFVEAALPCSALGTDVFRLYFGGADAVVGTALIQVLSSE